MRLENSEQVRQQFTRHNPNNKTAVTFKLPSEIHIARVMLKLLPVIINFRKDRREWVK